MRGGKWGVLHNYGCVDCGLSVPEILGEWRIGTVEKLSLFGGRYCSWGHHGGRVESSGSKRRRRRVGVGTFKGARTEKNNVHLCRSLTPVLIARFKNTQVMYWNIFPTRTAIVVWKEGSFVRAGMMARRWRSVERRKEQGRSDEERDVWFKETLKKGEREN